MTDHTSITYFPIDYRKPIDFIVHDRSEGFTINVPDDSDSVNVGIIDPEPMHPGTRLKETWMKEYNWNVTSLAKALGVTRPNLSKLLNAKAGISPKMALKLSAVFDVRAEYWLQHQMNYDLWKARND